MKFRNIHTGAEKTLEEYQEMLKKDAIEKFSTEDEEIMDLDIWHFKQEGMTQDEYIKLHLATSFDPDWKEIRD